MLPEFIKKFFRGTRTEVKETAATINSQITDAVTQVQAKGVETVENVKNEAVDLAVEATEKVTEKVEKNVKKAAKKAKGE